MKINLKKYKWVFYIFTFFLITVVATILSAMKPGDKVPDVSNAILLVGAVYLLIYLIYKFVKSFRNKQKDNETTKTQFTNKVELNGNLSKKKSILTKTFFLIGGASVLILLWVVILRLLGYQLNKDFFIPFDKQQCIEKEYPTYSHHPGIAGCIFWSRHDYLQNKEGWRNQFKKDSEYCSSKYKEDMTKPGYKSIFDGEYSDPNCNYAAFQDQKRKENWSYLTSKNKDQFYYSCVEQICPSQPLFK